MMALLGKQTIQLTGSCGECGSDGTLEADLEMTTRTLEPNPKVLTGVMNVELDGRVTKVRCRECGREHTIGEAHGG